MPLQGGMGVGTQGTYGCQRTTLSGSNGLPYLCEIGVPSTAVHTVISGPLTSEAPPVPTSHLATGEEGLQALLWLWLLNSLWESKLKSLQLCSE